MLQTLAKVGLPFSSPFEHSVQGGSRRASKRVHRVIVTQGSLLESAPCCKLDEDGAIRCFKVTTSDADVPPAKVFSDVEAQAGGGCCEAKQVPFAASRP